MCIRDRARLGEALLEPLGARLDGRPLVIVPYGELHDLPFHAFRVGGRALVQLCEVGYGLSLATLARARSTPPGASRSMLVTGAAGGSLPAVPREIETLRRIYAERCTEVPGEELARRLRSSEPLGGLVHVASHGLFEQEAGPLSGIQLGRSFLLARDVRHLELDLDLMVLSGCHTGRKQRIAGEELYGMTRALLEAGVRTTVSSLWAVEDGDAHEFMAAYYRELAAGRTARAAVARAQRERLEACPHPHSWAPYALTGDPLVRFPGPPAAC